MPAITVFSFKANKRYDYYNKQLTRSGTMNQKKDLAIPFLMIQTYKLRNVSTSPIIHKTPWKMLRK
jgi:hypothetical protein